MSVHWTAMPSVIMHTYGFFAGEAAVSIPPPDALYSCMAFWYSTFARLASESKC